MKSKGLLMLLGLVLSSSFLFAKDIIKTNVSDIGGLKESEWGESKESDKIKFRSVLAGKRGQFSVENWWGGSKRPAYGERFVLELLYQDNIKKPAIVSSFSGIGTNLAPSELHRIGGLDDKKWKTAYIPVSWDLLMLKPDETLAHFFVNNVDKESELPCADIKIRKAILPDDQIRYESESRAWVKREFAEIEAKFVPKEAKPLGEDLQTKTIIPFARAYYDKIDRYDVPTAEEINGRVYIRASLNEYESGAFGVHATKDVNNVTYKVSDLTNKDGKLDCNIKLFTMEYATLNQKNKDGSNSANYVGERLWPAYPENLKKGQNAWFWITIQTLEGKSKPGSYEGAITVTADNVTETLKIRVDILPIKLLTMEEAGLGMGGCVPGMVSEQELETMREYNHNMVNLWISGASPQMKQGKDRVDLSYYYLDDFMELCNKTNVKRIVWFLGGNPPAFPHTLTLERMLYSAFYETSMDDFFKILQAEDKRDKIIPEVRNLYKNFISDIVKHGDEKKWPELIFTPFDEPVKYSKPVIDKGYKYAVGTGLWTREHFIDSCLAIREASPKSKIYISMHHNFVRKPFGRVGEVFIPHVDIVNTNAIDEDAELNRKVLDKGKEFWQYSGIRGGRYNFGFYFGVHESTSSLVWAYNWGQRFNAYGRKEAQYGYHSAFGTIVTPEYELFREGWDDRRYLATYLALAKKKGVDTKEYFQKLKNDILGNLGESTVDKVEVFYVEELDKNKLEAARAQLAQKIIELSK